jgi:hypothetical protein
MCAGRAGEGKARPSVSVDDVWGGVGGEEAKQASNGEEGEEECADKTRQGGGRRRRGEAFRDAEAGRGWEGVVVRDGEGGCWGRRRGGSFAMRERKGTNLSVGVKWRFVCLFIDFSSRWEGGSNNESVARFRTFLSRHFVKARTVLRIKAVLRFRKSENAFALLDTLTQP